MFGIDMAPSGQENTQYNNLSGASSWATNQGQQDINQSSQFMSAILSGDPGKIGQVLGPQIQAIQGQGQQKKQVNAQFGNRGGGTNASNQTIGDDTTKGVNNMVSSLTGSAVSDLSSTGQNLLNTGMSGSAAAFGEANAMQKQKASQWNDIFKSISGIAGGVAGGVGNLDTTGGSTGMEQFQNFFSGA